MAIADTSFFSSYQDEIGRIFQDGVNKINNPSDLYQNFIQTRQDFVQNLGTSEVSSGLLVINAHLSSESVYSQANSNIVRNVVQNLNSFFSSTQSTTLREYFNGLSNIKNINWNNGFKEAWYQGTGQELIQQIGFISWNGTHLTFYPNTSTVTQRQNFVSISTSNGNLVTVSGFGTSLATFGLPGDYFIAYSGSFPSASSISFATTIVGYANNNTLILSGPIGSATSGYSYRKIKNNEYLEFRFASQSLTGMAATSILTPLTLNVTLDNAESFSVSLTTTNTTGRQVIGSLVATNNKSTGISSVLITSGTIAALGTTRSLEVWVKGNS